MSRANWIQLGLLCVAVLTPLVAGVSAFVNLQARVGDLESKDIEGARTTAIREIKDAGAAIANFENWSSRSFMWKHGQEEVKMIKNTEGICYLVYVAGKFGGGGEAVSIHVRGDYWYLGGKEGSKGEDIEAHARCWGIPSVEETQN